MSVKDCSGDDLRYFIATTFTSGLRVHPWTPLQSCIECPKALPLILVYPFASTPQRSLWLMVSSSFLLESWLSFGSSIRLPVRSRHHHSSSYFISMTLLWAPSLILWWAHSISGRLLRVGKTLIGWQDLSLKTLLFADTLYQSHAWVQLPSVRPHPVGKTLFWTQNLSARLPWKTSSDK